MAPALHSCWCAPLARVITSVSTVSYPVLLAGGGLGVAILDEHPGVAEFVVLATMLGVLVLIGGQSNKPSTSAIP
mgnify:CR=1 FL=1